MRTLLATITLMLIFLPGCGGGGGGGGDTTPADSDLWQGTWTLNTQETDWGELNSELPFYAGSYLKIDDNNIRVVLIRDGIVETDVVGTFSVDGTTFTSEIAGTTLVGTFDLLNDNTKVVIYWSEESGGDIEFYDKQPLTPVYSFGTSYLQYRVYENGTTVYQTWLPMTKNGVPIQKADIVNIRLFDSQNTSLIATRGAFQAQTFMHLNCTMMPCIESGPLVEHAYWHTYPSLSADTYSFEVDTVEGQTLSLDVPYPGQLSLPIVSAETMQSVWNENNLVLSWTNPFSAANWADVDKLRISLYDGTGNVVLNIQMNSSDQSVTLDDNLLRQAIELSDGILESWEVQTRAYDEDNRNFARSVSLRLGIAAPSL